MRPLDFDLRHLLFCPPAFGLASPVRLPPCPTPTPPPTPPQNTAVCLPLFSERGGFPDQPFRRTSVLQANPTENRGSRTRGSRTPPGEVGANGRGTYGTLQIEMLVSLFCVWGGVMRMIVSSDRCGRTSPCAAGHRHPSRNRILTPTRPRNGRSIRVPRSLSDSSPISPAPIFAVWSAGVFWFASLRDPLRERDREG